MRQINYIHVRFTCKDANERAIWGQKGIELGAEGSIEKEEQLELYFSEEARQASEHFCKRLEEAGIEAETDRIEDRDWNERWEKSFPPVHIGSDLVIRAPFHPFFPDRPYAIEVNPERAFGTGHHPTTCLMLEELLQIDLNDKAVLDMGCGTGILAILCEMKGASRVMAIDNDEWAVRNCAYTLEQNGCEKVDVEYGISVPWKGTRSDVILGNIEKGPLLEMIPDMARRLEAHGTLLLSGLREGDLEEIHNICVQQGLKAMEQKEADGWFMLKYRKDTE